MDDEILCLLVKMLEPVSRKAIWSGDVSDVASQRCYFDLSLLKNCCIKFSECKLTSIAFFKIQSYLELQKKFQLFFLIVKRVNIPGLLGFFFI